VRSTHNALAIETVFCLSLYYSSDLGLLFEFRALRMKNQQSYQLCPLESQVPLGLQNSSSVTG